MVVESLIDTSARCMPLLQRRSEEKGTPGSDNESHSHSPHHHHHRDRDRAEKGINSFTSNYDRIIAAVARSTECTSRDRPRAGNRQL